MAHAQIPPSAMGRGSLGGGARHSLIDHRCYTVCPPVVYPTGHDPYYDTSYFTYEKELHGGPFGPATLNPQTASVRLSKLTPSGMGTASKNLL